MKDYRVGFNKPWLAGNELRYIQEAVEQEVQLSGGGRFSRRCCELLESELGARKILLTTSCTHALEMCARLLDLGERDEVIVPSFAFVTTANAFASQGATPVFVDVRRDTLGIDVERAAERIGPRTRAVVALHYAGVACEMDELVALCREAGVTLIEDNAHGLFGSYKGRSLGTFGGFGTQSFHETKNFTCGEGGALLVNDERFVERCELVYEKGTDRRRFFRGQVDKYSWVDFGSSYAPSELQAAFLLAQLEARDEIQRRRRGIWERYRAELSDWAEQSGVLLPQVPADRAQSYHMFYLLAPSLEFREGLIAHLAERGIAAVFHFQPLHLSEMGLRFGGRPGECPVSEAAADRVLRLPFHNALTESEQGEVVEAVCAFRLGAATRPGRLGDRVG